MIASHPLVFEPYVEISCPLCVREPGAVLSCPDEVPRGNYIRAFSESDCAKPVERFCDGAIIEVADQFERFGTE
jgi:hypothetical protein